MFVDRRIIAVLMGSALATASVGLSHAETYVVSTLHPETHWAVTVGIVPYMECVKETSGGEIDYNLFASGQIASADASIEALNSNLAQLAYIVASRLTSELPLVNLAQLPNMGVDAKQMLRAFRQQVEDGGPIADELKAQHLVPLMVNPFPAYQLGMRDRSKKTVASISGSKLHVGGGSQSAAVEALGGVPVRMTASDIYVGLQQGIVDGYLLNIASADTYSLQEVTGTISTNANFASTMAFLAMNDAKFESLSPEHQAILRECGAKVEATLAAYADDQTSILEEKFRSVGVDVYAFDEAELELLNERLDASAAVFVKRLDDLGLPGTQAYDQYRAALAE